MFHRPRGVTRGELRGLAASGVLAVAAAWLGCGADGYVDLLGHGGEGGNSSTTGSSGSTDTSTASSSSSGGAGGGCEGTLSVCSGTCVDLANDPLHCGGCQAQSCLHYQYCQGSACYCRPGMTLCNGSCVDLASNPDHCGHCNNPCNAGDKCEAMACGPAPCTGTLSGCAASNGRTACVDLANEYPFCGACGVVCAVDEVCAGNHCQRYEPAAPCASCPCNACDALVGGPSTCCSGLYGGVDPICVAGMHCP